MRNGGLYRGVPFLITRDEQFRATFTPNLIIPTRGVRAESDDWWERVRAFSLVLPTLTVFSHTTAALIQSLPLPRELELPLHVTTDVSQQRGRRKGLVWHRRPMITDLDRWHGLPVTKPLRTWRDLGGLLVHEELVVVADVLLRRRLCTVEQLQDVTGRRHAKALGRAAAAADGASASPEETRLRLALRDRGLPPPQLNKHIINDGEWLGCGDFVWDEYRVVADYDGEHHASTHQRHQDAQTRDDYAAAGWRHVTITSEMTRDQAVDRVERALRERGWRPVL